MNKTGGSTSTLFAALPALTGDSRRDRVARRDRVGRTPMIDISRTQTWLLAEMAAAPAVAINEVSLTGPGVYLLTYAPPPLEVDPRLAGAAADGRAIYIGSTTALQGRVRDHAASVRAFGLDPGSVRFRAIELEDGMQARLAEGLLLAAIDSDLQGSGMGCRAVGSRRESGAMSTVDAVLGSREGRPAISDGKARAEVEALALRLRSRRMSVRWP